MGKSQPKARQIKLTPQRNPTTKEKKCTATTLHLSQSCKVFSTKFNIMAAILPTKRPPCRKNSILAKVRCDTKKGLVCEYDKMNIYLKKPPFEPDFGRFAAKYSAICC